MIGKTVGSYQVTAKLGAGGMGEVYRARDTKLNRDVAIKVLPEAFALDADRLARFTREAQVLASLNHPNIAGIYGIEANAIVMELVEGRDLSELIRSSEAGGIPLLDAIAIARQIIDALEAAHEQGIIHRDLKPQNIKVRDDGTVKVLDFGLAKAMGAPGSEDPGLRTDGGLANSPTMTARATQMGMIIGTAAYMAPEQARGRAVDRRADIWAFGVVLYEMLTGSRGFEGEDISVTLANVIKEDPKWDALPADLHPSIKRLLRRCLEKDPKRRLGAISDARLELEEAALPFEGPSAASQNRSPVRSSSLPWGIAWALAVALVAGAVWLWPQPAPVPAAIQFTLDPPEGTTFTPAAGFLSISPDGQHIAFMTGPQNDAQLWIRPLNALEARPVPAATNGWHVAWSPDQQSIVYASTGQLGLRRVDLAGGPVRIVTDDAIERAAWGRDGVIVFTPRTAPQRLVRVPSAGGTTTPVTELNVAAGEVAHYWPAFLPDGKRFIFLAANRDPSKSALFLASLDSMERTHLLDVHSMAEVVPGYLLYHREGTVYAHPFDDASAQFTGDPVPIVENVQFNRTNGRAAFGSSRAGHLVYRTGDGLADDATLSWLDRTGKVVGTIGQPGGYSGGALSPDGRRYVVAVVDETGGRDLVMVDIERNITSRFTSDAAIETLPLWTTDGESVVFSSNRKGVFDLYIKNAGGATPERPLFESADAKYASGFSPDGKLLLFSTGPASARQVWALSLVGDAKPYRVLPDEAEEHSSARFSPDGTWLAYNAGNPSNVFVQPFPATGYREQISATQGSIPKWTADGRQIAFAGGGGSVMIADVTPAGGRLRVSAPRLLFEQRQRSGASGFTMDDRAERFLLVVPPLLTREASEAPLTVIANWPSLVNKK